MQWGHGTRSVLFIEGADGCEAKRMCNPQVTFYRDGYNIILNTWQSMFADSMSSDGPGLCKGGVNYQVHKGGAVFEYTWVFLALGS